MKKLALALLISPYLLMGGYSSSQHKISSTIKNRMTKGNSWRKGCPVGLQDLRYLKMTYRNFQGKDVTGEMIVHKSVSKEVRDIFAELYRAKYPIKKMKLVSNYKASDFQSIEADNTSAFNCRPVTGGTKWSRHSFGKAIDINPIENPYISRSGRISHKRSLKYRKRLHKNPHIAADNAVILKGDTAVKSFKKRGWRWGGDWNSIKDYQHFDKR